MTIHDRIMGFPTSILVDAYSSVLRFLFHGGWRGRRANFLLLVTYVYFLFWASDSHEDRDTSIFLYYDDCRGDFFTL